MRRKLLLKASITLLVLFSLGYGSTLDRIMERQAQALGGMERLMALSSFVAKGVVRLGGLEGSVTEWGKYPDRCRERIDLKVLKQEMGTDGNYFWKVDQNNQVSELKGKEREDLITSRCISNFCYLLSPTRRGVSTYLGKSSRGGKSYHVLLLKPQGGSPAKLWINDSTWLVDMVQTTVFQETVTVTYDDYREVEGVKVAFHAHQTTGNPLYDVDTWLQEVAFNLELSDSLFLPPKERGKDYRFLQGRSSEGIPFDLYGNTIWLKVWVDSKGPYRFLLDSGAGATCIDSSLASELGLRVAGVVEGKGAGGSQTVSFCEVPSLKLKGVEFLDQTIAVISLSRLYATLGRQIDGILGYDFLSRFVSRIGYGDRSLSLYDPESYDYPKWMRLIDMEVTQNLPTIEAVLDGEYEVKFLLDTGNSGGLVLHSSFIQHFQILEKVKKKVEKSFRGVGGWGEGFMAKMKSLTIGDFTIREPIALLVTSGRGIFGSKDLAGNIGGEILKKFDLTLDYSRGKLGLEPNHSFSSPPAYNRSGIGIIIKGGKLVVREVLEGSAAQVSGVKVDDQIVAVNGLKAVPDSLQRISEIFQGPAGTKVDLELVRDGKPIKIKLTLRDIF